MEESWRSRIVEAIAKSHGWRTDVPVSKLPPEALQYLLYAPRDERVVIGYRHERGENTYNATFEGVVTNLERRYRETDSEYIKTELEKFMVSRPCPACDGRRLKPEALAVTVDGRNISEVANLSITGALASDPAPPGAPDRARADDRPPAPQGDRRRGSASWSTSGSTT